jgi:hypothetical protein
MPTRSLLHAHSSWFTMPPTQHGYMPVLPSCVGVSLETRSPTSPQRTQSSALSIHLSLSLDSRRQLPSAITIMRLGLVSVLAPVPAKSAGISSVSKLKPVASRALSRLRLDSVELSQAYHRSRTSQILAASVSDGLASLSNLAKYRITHLTALKAHCSSPEHSTENEEDGDKGDQSRIIGAYGTTCSSCIQDSTCTVDKRSNPHTFFHPQNLSRSMSASVIVSAPYVDVQAISCSIFRPSEHLRLFGHAVTPATLSTLSHTLQVSDRPYTPHTPT